MNRSTMLGRSLLALLGVVIATRLWAFPGFARETKSACATCHANAAGGAVLTAAGTEFKADGREPGAQAAKSAQYVGVNRCRMCHIKQHKAWSETPHARAWSGLVKADPKRTAELAAALKLEMKGAPTATDGCVTCHVTGFQLAGGFPQADSTKAANLANVTCESCHGPGSLHLSAPLADKKKTIQRVVSGALCMQCHTPVMSPAFKLEEFLKRGTHVVAP